MTENGNAIDCVIGQFAGVCNARFEFEMQINAFAYLFGLDLMVVHTKTAWS